MSKVNPEPRWPASVAMAVCAGLYFVLPDRLVVGPRWGLPILIVLPLVPLSAVRHRHPDESPHVRYLTLSLIGLVTLANVVSMALLVHHLLHTQVVQGRALIYSAVAVWLTNVIVFGLWFWEVDRGGPHRRAGGDTGYPDLQFPQMENPQLAPPDWRPSFTDYLYTAFANGTSFAPADAMPLTLRLKALFLAESLVSLITIAVVAARAVNILR
ncbi:MAG: DUF1345 domain-containing protein [Acidobacteriota bacterium]|nr:DUF1345 domain-containing protein [Acidobacteriota bacterium]